MGLKTRIQILEVSISLEHSVESTKHQIGKYQRILPTLVCHLVWPWKVHESLNKRSWIQQQVTTFISQIHADFLEHIHQVQVPCVRGIILHTTSGKLPADRISHPSPPKKRFID